MKTYLRILVILIMVSSCQENKKKEGDLNAIIKKEKISQKKNKDASKVLKSKKMPTKAQFEAFFPKEKE